MNRGLAIVTGASAGIGRDIARVLAAKEYDLAVVARRRDRLVELAEEITAAHPKVRVFPVVGDLSKPEQMGDLYRRCAEHGDVRVLVNNAGFGSFGPFVESPLEVELSMVNVNITSLVALTHHALKDMTAAKQGSILNIASMAGFQPGPLMATYYASKAFVISFSQAIANEGKDAGVTCTAFCPGVVRTEFQDVADMHNSAMVKDRKLPTCREVAEAAVSAMQNGTPVKVHGFMNALMVQSVRFFPRRAITAFVRRYQRPL